MDLRTRPVTEEEASKLICPFTFSIAEIPQIREGGPWNCRGRACMLWRWKNYGTTGPVEPTGYCGAGGDPS
jgi:hypothetical protein